MTKKNYQAKQLMDYEKKEAIKRLEPTNCYRCDGYDMTCSKYVVQSNLYVTNCQIKRNLQPESELEKKCRN